VSRKVRFSQTQAAKEFGISVNTLRQRLADAKLEPDENHTWSVKQILSVLDSRNPARDREAKGRAENWRLRVKLLESKLLDRADYENAMKQLIPRVIDLIEASSIDRFAAHDAKTNLERWPDCVAAVVARASRGVVKEDLAEKETSPEVTTPKPERPKGPMSAYRRYRELESKWKGDYWELKNGKLTGKYVDSDELYLQTSPLMLSTVEIIRSGFIGIGRQDARDDLLRSIASYPIHCNERSGQGDSTSIEAGLRQATN
jgi:hypothetical protein